MIKIITILLCSFAISSASVFNLLSILMFTKSEVPVRVRTIAERDRRINESVILDFIGLVEQYDGYKAEEHNVTTNDGYVLTMHRVTASPVSKKTNSKPVVYIQHGLFGSSDFFVLFGPQQSLVFQLADAGYDVWLGNIRGNTYSRSHTKYSLKDPEFWNFRIDEIAMQDVSTFIDSVLENTGQKKLTYIGYSMGTTLSYMLLSTKSEYNEKINIAVSLAPVAFFTRPVKPIVETLSRLASLQLKGSKDILSHSVSVVKFAKESCTNVDANGCRVLLAPLLDLKSFNAAAIPKIMSYSPAGASYYTIKHLQQLIYSGGKLQAYDYPCGIFFDTSCRNKELYNQSTPIQYNLSLITVSNAIFYANNDALVKEEDALYLKTKLKNVIVCEKIADEEFNHLDFIWSSKAKSLVYNELLDLINKYK